MNRRTKLLHRAIRKLERERRATTWAHLVGLSTAQILGVLWPQALPNFTLIPNEDGRSFTYTVWRHR